MLRRPPKSTRTYTPLPYTTRFRALAGWAVGAEPFAQTLAAASGAAFAAVVLGQLGNAFACRSEYRWAGALRLTGNQMLLMAVGVELVLLDRKSTRLNSSH